MLKFAQCSLPVAWIAIPAVAVAADPIQDWRGLLYACGTHPTVHIPANVAYAYEKDLTRYTEGKVSFKRASVTVSFPGRYGTFTITRRGRDYMSGKMRCTVDRV